MTNRCAAVALVLVGCVLVGAVAFAHQPPTNLKKVGDHWTAWDSPEAGPQDHIIVRGDTLWDLAERWFGDPFLWPQIWDENRYILDSHWIYPGDPLVVPGRPTVVPEVGQGLPPVADASDRSGDSQQLPTAPEPDPLLPAAIPEDLYCSGFISHVHDDPEMWIADADLEHEFFAAGDIVFLSHGRNHGISAGDEFAIIRRTDNIRHPTDRRSLGTYVRRLGKLRVMIAHDESATAMIEDSCEDLTANDELVPWKELPIPMLAAEPFDRFDTDPSGGATGVIVAVKDHITAFGQGNVIYTDLGYTAGVEPGDRIVLFRERANTTLPRVMLGSAVILAVDGETSTAKIMDSSRESYIGDSVEVRR